MANRFCYVMLNKINNEIYVYNKIYKRVSNDKTILIKLATVPIPLKGGHHQLLVIAARHLRICHGNRRLILIARL